MKFGPVPLSQAEGAILAHSLALPDGRLRKGLILKADHVAQLRAAGLRDVVAARLEPDDLHEDAAALRVAQALAEDAAGLHLSRPFTGRVNLIADAPGVARIDPARIDAANAIDAMITVATVPRWQRMDPGGMIATVKIISYGVDKQSISSACDAARGGVGLCPSVLRDAVLIETMVDAGAGSDKGYRVMQARLARLDVALTPRVTVPHAVAPLADMLAARREALILVLTGSATSDKRDVAPEALRRAGGRLIRFGMPVDPGNLLFLGDLHGCPVIGLPGSARSPALSGVDRVLERVICNVAPDAAEIAAMGVGGLLKEIPTRPMPRRGKSSGV